MFNSSKKIWLPYSLLSEMIKDLQKWFPRETGGILIGYWSQNEAVITKVIDGGPEAIRNPSQFLPDNNYHIHWASKIYKNSCRTEYYLGDWHTHPNNAPYLSSTDKKTLMKIADYPEARLKFPLMLIIGTDPLLVKVWYHRRTKFYNKIKEGWLEIF